MVAMSDRSSGRVECASAFWPVSKQIPTQIGNDSVGRVMEDEMSRRYASQERVAAVAEAMTDRDWLIVETLQSVKVATGHQLERLHFDLASGDQGSASRHRRRVLLHLVQLQVVSRLERQIGGVRAGSAGFVYGLDVVGRRLLALHGAAPSAWRRVWTPGISFLQHRLAITELFVQLTEAERGGTSELLEFVAEPDCWRSFIGRGGARLWLKPDAYARVAAARYEYLWFVEVDRAAESRPTLKAKCQRYVDYWLSGREDTRSSVFPAVVWLVPDHQRVEVIAGVIDRLPVDSRRLFRVGLFANAVEIFSGRDDADPAA